MPAAYILYLEAQHDGAIYGATGQHAAGLWLNSRRGPDPELGDALHDERPLRQFTVSPLLGLTNVRHGVTRVATGDEARVRLTILDESIRPRLPEDGRLGLPDEVTCGGVAWRVRGVSHDPADHPGAGLSSYAELRDRHRHGDAPGRWALAFESPTAFHLQDGAVMPFPLPGLLVAGWLNRWNEYSPCPLLEADDSPGGFLARVEAGLRVSRYRLKTVSFRFRHPGPDGRRTREVPQIGCVGDLALDGSALAAADRAAVASLVDFAFYCGSGHHTAMGMGQTRIINN